MEKIDVTVKIDFLSILTSKDNTAWSCWSSGLVESISIAWRKMSHDPTSWLFGGIWGPTSYPVIWEIPWKNDCIQGSREATNQYFLEHSKVWMSKCNLFWRHFYETNWSTFFVDKYISLSQHLPSVTRIDYPNGGFKVTFLILQKGHEWKDQVSFYVHPYLGTILVLTIFFHIFSVGLKPPISFL